MISVSRINSFNPIWPSGQYSFNQAFTQGPDPTRSSANAGDGLASLLLETPASGQITTDPGVSMQNFYYAAYAQDDIKLTTRPTLNLRLGYETETPYTERRNQLVAFDPSLKNPAANASNITADSPRFEVF